MSTVPSVQPIRFGPFELHLESGELFRNGRKVRLQEQCFQLLRVLSEHPGQVVTREELQRLLWAGDTFVDFDSGLNNAVKRLRDALGDTAAKPRYIETLPRRGYRFLPTPSTVESAPAPEPVAQDPESTANSGHYEPLPERQAAPPSWQAAVEPQKLPPAPIDEKKTSVRNLPRIAAVGVCITVFILAIVAFADHMLKARRPGEIKSIAVLPLKDLAGDPSQAYLSEGITDGIVANLSRYDSLRIVSRPAANKYRDLAAPASRIAQELGVDGIVEGSVSRVGDRLNIDVKLIRASDDRRLWEEDYARPVKEVIHLESELAEGIRRQLGAKPRPSGETESQRNHSVDPITYDLYLQGKYHEKLFRREDNDLAISLFEKVVARDPEFAEGQAALAFEYGTRANEVNHSDESWNRKAFVAVEKCIELEPQLADCYQTRATLTWTLPNHFPYASGIADLKHALALNPNLDEAEQQLANIYNHIGLIDKAKPHLVRALEINPSNTAARFRTATNQNYEGQYEDALNSLRASERFSPYFWGYHDSYALMHLGRVDQAQSLLQKLIHDNNQSDAVSMLISQEAVVAALAGDSKKVDEKVAEATRRGRGFEHFHHSEYSFAMAYALLDKRAQAMDWLQKASEDGLPCYPMFNDEPYLKNLHGDKRYEDLMIQLKSEWRHNEESL